MDTTGKILEEIRALQAESRRLLDEDSIADAMERIDEALALESINLGTLTLRAEALERLGKEEAAKQLHMRIKALKREAWQRQVEAEIRGHHEVLGDPIRHETP